MIGTICVWKLKERIEQDRRNSLIKRWHWKCSQTDTWFSSKNFLNNFKLLYFFHIFNRKFQNVSEKHLFFHFLLQFSTPILPRKPHPILFLLLKSSKIAGNINEKFMFSWLCPEESVIKPSEIAIFGLKMTYIRYRNRPLWTTPIFKLEFFSRYCYRI